MNRYMQALADDMAEIFSDNAMPADPWDDGSLPMIAKPHGLDVVCLGNEAIEEVNQSVLDDEAANPHKRKDYMR